MYVENKRGFTFVRFCLEGQSYIAENVRYMNLQYMLDSMTVHHQFHDELGGFAKAIVDAWYKADPDQEKIILRAFADTFERWAQILAGFGVMCWTVLPEDSGC